MMVFMEMTLMVTLMVAVLVTGDNNAVHGDSDSGGDCDDLEEDDDE